MQFVGYGTIQSKVQVEGSALMPTSRFVQQDVEYPNRLEASTHRVKFPYFDI